MDEFRGWWNVVLLNGRETQINIEKIISDTHGHILFLVSFDKVYYNFNNVVSLKKVIE